MFYTESSWYESDKKRNIDICVYHAFKDVCYVLGLLSTAPYNSLGSNITRRYLSSRI